MSTKPIAFKTQEDIKNFIDQTWKEHGLEGRDELARVLGISTSTLYGYITRQEIPEKTHQKFGQLAEEVQKRKLSRGLQGVAEPIASDLSKISLDDLLKEIEKRGWRVDLSRILKDK